MKCISCGFEIQEGRKFCTNCGVKIELPSVAEIEEEKIADTSNEEREDANDEYVPPSTKAYENQSKKTNQEFSKLSEKVLAKKAKKQQKKSKKLLENIVALATASGLIIIFIVTNNYFNFDSVEEYDVIEDKNYLTEEELDKKLEKEWDERRILDKRVRENHRRKMEARIEKYGIFKVDMNSISIDRDHFNSYGEITYVANLIRGNEPNETYSLSCRTNAKYDWDREEWRLPNNTYEKSMIRDICNSKKGDPEIIPLLQSDGWTSYVGNNWINTKDWVEDKTTDYQDFNTNYYSPDDQKTTEISVDCSGRQLNFLREEGWGTWKKPLGVYKQIVNDKCNQISSNHSTIYKAEDSWIYTRFKLVWRKPVTKRNRSIEYRECPKGTNLYYLDGKKYKERFYGDDFFITECLTSEQSSFLIEHWEQATGGNVQFGYDGVFFEGIHNTFQSAWESSPPLSYRDTPE